MPDSSGPLLVCDTPHLLYRAFFGLPDSIKGADGRPVNALLGSMNATLWCIERHKPRAVVQVFGEEDAAYRVAALPQYHADRPPMPDDLRHQWEQAPELYRALGWTVTAHDALEADDLLGELARREEAADGSCLILTGDRDMFQCVTDRVHVLLQQRGGDGPTTMDRAAVVERYGVLPEQVPDFIALRGDPSDGIPGAKGIGAKGAADILRRHGTLEAALAAATRETAKRARTALTTQADELRSFREIATLQPVPELEDVADAPTDFAGGAAAAKALGMNALAKRLDALAAA